MSWLDKLFRTKRPPPAPPPTYAEMMREIMTRDRLYVSPYLDAGFGTYGAVIADAVKLGYLRKVRPWQFTPEGGWSDQEYEPTQLGRNRYP